MSGRQRLSQAVNNSWRQNKPHCLNDRHPAYHIAQLRRTKKHAYASQCLASRKRHGSRCIFKRSLIFFLLHQLFTIEQPQCEAAKMAPYPDSTATPTPDVQPNPDEESTLPGMKRGIAIGVACSVFIIMVALLAFFAYRRRKQQATKAKHSKLVPQEPVEMDAGVTWPPPRQEKGLYNYTVPIEADAYVVHELDGSEVPELPGNFEGQMLADKRTPRTSYHAGDDNAYIHDIPHQWIEWAPPSTDTPAQTPQGHVSNHNLYLEVTPLHRATSVSPVVGPGFQTTNSFSVSPIAPSPLEDVHISQSFPRQQRYYDHFQAST